MNKTQKEAWFNLGGALLMAAVYSHIAIQLFVIRKPFGLISLCLCPLSMILFVIGQCIICRRKRNSHEVDKDEQDKLILKRAAIAAFAAFVLLLLSAYVVLYFVVGLNGSIPVWSIPVFLIIVAMPAIMLVYSVAILVQYGKGGKSHE
jgi:polyferredoxin